MLSHCRVFRSFSFCIGFTAIIFAFSALAIAADTARIEPTGKVSMYRADKKVDELSAAAPLPYDVLLKCVEQCGVRMGSLYFVASDQSSFSIGAPPQDNLIQFVNGNFYFSLTELPRRLVIKTPVEDFTVQQVLLQTAAIGSKLDGYIFVKGDSTEIGVLDGGSLVVSSSHGEHVVRAGNQITIAQADMHPEMEDGAATIESGDNTRNIIIGGAVGAAAIAAAVWALSDDDDDGDVSPSTP